MQTMGNSGLKLSGKWILFGLGVPTLAYIFLSTSVQYIFETATRGWQIFIGVGILACLIFLYIFLIIKLVEETKEFFKS